MTLKQELKVTFLQRLNDKIDALHDILQDLTQGAQTDVKSSAGDKHETTLSMMHLEQENVVRKINETIAFQEIISRIEEDRRSQTVEFGSVVKLNSVSLFLSAALPSVTINGTSFVGVSMDAPIAKALLGRKLNDSFTFNNCDFTISYLE